MTATDLHFETGATIQEWRSGLGLLVSNRLYDHHTDLHQRFGAEGRIVFRQAAETLLAHLAVATLRGRPELFADRVLDDDAVPAGISLSAADLGTTLEQMRDTLRQYMPGPRGELACEYVEFALVRHTGHSRSDQPLRNAA